MEDGYGSDEWGDINDEDLIAAADEAEQLASSSSKPPSQVQSHWGGGGLGHLFLEDDFDDFDDEEIQSAAVPKFMPFTLPKPEVQGEVHYPSLKALANSTITSIPAGQDLPVQREEKGKSVRKDDQHEKVGASKKRHVSSRSHRKTNERSRARKRVKNHENTKPKVPDKDNDGALRQGTKYSGTIFPRLTMAYEEDLTDAVAVAGFSLSLMDILTSVLREFLQTNISLYPRQKRQEIASGINRMVGHRKADDSFHGWDFLALANFVINHRSMLPLSIRNQSEIIERLRVLKTTVRWTFAHTSLENQERKHPIELSLWAINTLLLIENLGVPLSYAARVMELHQGLWNIPSASSLSGSESLSQASSVGS